MNLSYCTETLSTHLICTAPVWLLVLKEPHCSDGLCTAIYVDLFSGVHGKLSFSCLGMFTGLVFAHIPKPSTGNSGSHIVFFFFCAYDRYISFHLIAARSL